MQPDSRLETTAGVTYAYDGSSHRVSKSSDKFYRCGSGRTRQGSSNDDIFAETYASANTTAENIFFAGQRIAMLPAGGISIDYVEDLLGTSRVTTHLLGTDFRPRQFVQSPAALFEAQQRCRAGRHAQNPGR